jgi:DtxR family transcriptional regulator, Mn-dependent transcriptional regulator
METKETLSSSLEDYLEAIYNLVSENKVARSKDIATCLKVSKASVTGALRHLSEKGLINYDPYKFITMTDRGEMVAKLIVRRHEVLKEFLIDILSIEPELADESACKMEHAISGEVIDKLLLFANFIKKNECKFLKGFKDFKCDCITDIDQTKENKG